ncbi:MAG TPA: hypothetical protein VFD36_20680 [Kofleriaceae bacterium]|nr:hypothetical protein [Kofleriaceae bacterium]
MIARAKWLLMLCDAYDYGDHVEDPEAFRIRLGTYLFRLLEMR